MLTIWCFLNFCPGQKFQQLKTFIQISLYTSTHVQPISGQGLLAPKEKKVFDHDNIHCYLFLSPEAVLLRKDTDIVFIQTGTTFITLVCVPCGMGQNVVAPQDEDNPDEPSKFCQDGTKPSYINIKIYLVAMLVTHPACAISTTRQNPPI